MNTNTKKSPKVGTPTEWKDEVSRLEEQHSFLPDVEPFAFTWCPTNFHQKHDHVLTWTHHISLLQKIMGTSRKDRNLIFLNPELTVAGAMHWHGIVYIANKYLWHKSQAASFRKIGFIYPKKIEDDYWVGQYIKKDSDLMQQLLSLDKVFYCNCIKCYTHIKHKVVLTELEFYNKEPTNNLLDFGINLRNNIPSDAFSDDEYDSDEEIIIGPRP